MTPDDDDSVPRAWKVTRPEGGEIKVFAHEVRFDGGVAIFIDFGVVMLAYAPGQWLTVEEA